MEKKKVGRPSKGERRHVNSPVPIEGARDLQRYAELTGEPMGATMARIFMAHRDELHLDELEAQEAERRGQERMDFEETTQTG